MGMPPPGMGPPPMPPPTGGFPMTQPGQDGIQYVQLVKNASVLKLDLVVDESTQSRDSRERHFMALMQIIPMALQAGVPVPPEVIDYAPLPETLRIKWRELIKQKQSQPPQPPIQLAVEQMRGETAKQLQQMKNETDAQSKAFDTQLKNQHEQVKTQVDAYREQSKAQAEAQKQEAQAVSQRIVDQSKLHLDATVSAMEQQREREKMMMEAKLNTFEVLLKAVVDMSTQAQAHQQKMEQSLAAPKEGGIDKVMPQMADLQSQIGQVMKLLSAPVELTRDPVTGKKRARRVIQ